MNDCSSTRIVNAKMPSVTTAELNNNNNSESASLDGIYRPRSESRGSTVSSASSSNETSEEIELPDLAEDATRDDAVEGPDKRRFRSMSDGSPALSASEEPFEVFPSLPDSVLEKMGLLGDSAKERLNEEESEQKFVALALAFSIDATTIKDRCYRQRRYRDQTEKNLTTEIGRLIDKVYRMQPLCVDAETTEMLTDLLTQVDIVMRASAYAIISAERYGAIQHEERLSQSVELMIKHVSLLRQQRDSARKHLQYTKRMLQNTSTASDPPTANKEKVMHSRRASIAIINQQTPVSKINGDVKRIARRTSEMSIRASALRNSRPSRLELGVDLVKIKEGALEEINQTSVADNMLGEQEASKENPENSNSQFIEKNEIEYSSLPFKQKIAYRMKKIGIKSKSVYKQWCEDGTMQELFYVGTLMCFSLSVISLGNILVELECAKYGCETSDWNFGDLCIDFFPYVTNNYEQKDITT